MKFSEIETPEDLHDWAKGWAADEAAFGKFQDCMHHVDVEFECRDNPMMVMFRNSSGEIRSRSGKTCPAYFLEFRDQRNALIYVLPYDLQTGRYLDACLAGPEVRVSRVTLH